MIDAKTAALKARNYLVEIVGIQPENATIEEVEVNETDNIVLITLGYWVSMQQFPMVMPTKQKEYKVFIVDRDSGEVLSMKIRSVDVNK